MGDAPGTADVSGARRLWLLFEPLHALVYFAAEHRRAQDAVGLKGGWMAYFASRAAPLGVVPAPVVTAAFYNFAPSMVARALPDAWALASPGAVLEARYAALRQALDRTLPHGSARAALPEVVGLLRSAITACDLAGRPMFAANAALPWPSHPLEALWHATTLLREHRGDGHVAALMAHDLDGCESHLLAVAAGRTSTERLRPFRGWTDEQWRAAEGRLAARGLVDRAGRCTDDGWACNEAVEALTDRLATAPWEHLGHAGTRRLEALLQPLAAAAVAGGDLPFPNAIGLPASAAAT